MQTLNYQSISLSDYNITSDNSLVNERNNVTPEINSVLEEIYEEVNSGKASTIEKIKSYIERYPEVPQLKNYLEKAYEAAGKMDKMRETTRWILKEHPDYLFGKLNQANYMIEDGKPERVPEILGEQMDLKALYPDREQFHIVEVLNFFSTCMRYYLAVDDRESAERSLQVMEEVGPEWQITVHARRYWMQNNLEKAREKLGQQVEGRVVKSGGYDKSVQTAKSPNFHHEEIKKLYKHDMRIDSGVVREILNLPEDTLIADLEKVVEDGIRRFEYFKQVRKSRAYRDEKQLSFVKHALFMLAELEAEESLDVMLRLFRQGVELLEFWFGELLDEVFWEIVYILGRNKLDKLKEFIKEPNQFSQARVAVSTAVAQMALHEPGRRGETMEWYEEVFDYFLDNVSDDRLISTDVISLMVWNCVDIKAVELEDTIRKIYRHDLVDTDMMGYADNVIGDIKSKSYSSVTRPLLTILERYSRYNNYLEGDASGANYFEMLMERSKELEKRRPESRPGPNQPFEALEEPGRNDPCPCGSGRKYKHCCLD